MYEAFQVRGFGPDYPYRYPASYGLPVSRKGVMQITQASDYSNSSCPRYKCPEDFWITAFLWRKSSDPGTNQLAIRAVPRWACSGRVGPSDPRQQIFPGAR